MKDAKKTMSLNKSLFRIFTSEFRDYKWRRAESGNLFWLTAATPDFPLSELMLENRSLTVSITSKLLFPWICLWVYLLQVICSNSRRSTVVLVSAQPALTSWFWLGVDAHTLHSRWVPALLYSTLLIIGKKNTSVDINAYIWCCPVWSIRQQGVVLGCRHSYGDTWPTTFSHPIISLLNLAETLLFSWFTLAEAKLNAPQDQVYSSTEWITYCEDNETCWLLTFCGSGHVEILMGGYQTNTDYRGGKKLGDNRYLVLFKTKTDVVPLQSVPF